MELKYSKSMYSKEALLMAAYGISDWAYVHLAQDDQFWNVSYTVKPGEEGEPPEVFENELIRQELQLTLVRENATIRQLLIGRALASTMIDSAAVAESIAPDQDEYDEATILRGWFDHDTSAGLV